MPARTVLVLLFLVLSGCVQPAGTPNGPPQTLGATALKPMLDPGDEISIARGDSPLIDLVGVGWTRLNIVAKQSLTLNVTVSHADFNLSARPGDPRTDARPFFGVGNHTSILVNYENEPDTNGKGFSLMWWGLPQTLVANGGYTPLKLAAGERATLLVATTVPGFRVQLFAGATSGDQYMKLRLVPNPAYGYWTPEPTKAAIVDEAPIRLMRQRVWAVERREYEPGMLRAVGWNIHPNTGPQTFTGVYQDEIRISRSNQTTSPARPAPYIPGSGRSASFAYARVDLSDAGEFEMFRRLVDSQVGIEADVAGAAFLALPYDLR